jgi:hypothetical protein
LARDREHLLRGVHTPDPRAALGERRGERARPAADVENAPTEEVTLYDQELGELSPALVERAEPIVVPCEGPEVWRVRR